MSATPLVPYSSLTDNLFTALTDGSLTLVGSVTLNASAPQAVNMYDGTLNLGIGAGLLLTSGHTPGLVNDIGWDGTDNGAGGDPDIDAVVNSVFQTQSYDATTLAFSFTTTNATATSISFDVVFGSEEYPEWVDQFVDCAVVMVNGVNYALFNHDPAHPLSVISSNLAAGYFNDNADSHLNIQYDGVSNVLKIVAPINPGQTNTIKIGIADTGDHVYDSGIFIANLSAGNTPGSGVVVTVPGTGGDDTITGSAKDELIDLKGGNDVAYAGGGDDIVVGGGGNDIIYGGTGNDVLEGDAGNNILDGGDGTDTAVFAGSSTDYSVSHDAVTGSYTISKAGESDILTTIEQAKFSDGLFDFVNGQMVSHSNPVVTPTNSPGSVTISGIAMAGKTLTAIATDPNGIGVTSVITYQWQSSGNGTVWTNGATTQTYTVTAGDVGKQIRVNAGYTDLLSFVEAPVSASVTIAQATSGISIKPMVISAPPGASVMDPLTTLIKNAVDLGYTPNQATLAVKSVFGIASTINIPTYDAYAILSKPSSDATALAYMKLAGQVAMTASVSDPTGMNLTLAVLAAATANAKLDLANTTDLATAGLDASSVSAVAGLNKDMKDAGSFSTIKSVWNDWAGKQDQLKPFSNHLEVISVHINQAPTGSSTAVLPDAQLNTGYVIQKSVFLAGFTDPENNPLSVTSITSDAGNPVIDNGNGSWTFTPSKEGPHEVNYTVSDGNGGTIGASVMVVVQTTPPMTLDAPPAAAPYVDTEIYDTNLPPAAGTLTVSNAAGGTLTFGIDGITPATGFAEKIGIYGALSVNTSTGGYTYTPDPVALNALTAADTLVHDSFVFTVSDGLGATATQNYTVDLTGANDLLVVDQVITDVVDTVGDDPISLLKGFITTQNVDNSSKAVSYSVDNGIGNYGTLAVDSVSGAYTYTSFDLNWMPEGYFDTDLFAVKVTDTNGATTTQSFMVNVTGANDPTSFDGATTGLVAENGTLIAGGTLTVSDRDTGEAVITVQSGAPGVYGAFSIGTDGVWSYTLNNSSPAVMTLNSGQSVTDTFAVATAGGVSQNIDIMINGANEIINGTATADTLNGTPYGDTISGMAGNDILNGYAGDDTLDGGVGIDTLVGGDGNDTYIVDNSIDVVSETNALAAGGIDLVKSSATYMLGNNVENLLLTGTGAINGTGNALNNIITGNSGNNALDGKAGIDTLDGGEGSDTYLFYLASDHSAAEITDTGLSGVDEVRFAAPTASTLTLYAGDTGIERVVLGTLSTANVALNTDTHLVTSPLTIVGNAAANIMIGTGFNDTLSGGKGADLLTGGAGMDTFTFVAGDSGQLTNFDKITDFTKGVVGSGDLIDYAVNLTIGGSSVAATPTQAFIDSTTGVATFAASSGTTLTDALADIATRFTAATDSQGEFALFTVGGAGDNYLFVSDGTAGVTSNDLVIQLAGVTSVGQVNLAGGNLTLIA